MMYANGFVVALNCYPNESDKIQMWLLLFYRNEFKKKKMENEEKRHNNDKNWVEQSTFIA